MLRLCCQSFCAALQSELTEYYRLIAYVVFCVIAWYAHCLSLGAESFQCKLFIAVIKNVSRTFETQVVAALSTDSASLDASAVSKRTASLTLKRLLVWVDEPMQKMRLMAMLADSATGLHGGALASAIDSHLRHGDAAIASFVFRVMQQLCVPLYQLIRNWLFSGVLDDPFSEFFVAVDANVPKERFCTFYVCSAFSCARYTVLTFLRCLFRAGCFDAVLCRIRARQVLAAARNDSDIYT